MALAAALHRRFVLGAATLSLLAMAGLASTFAATSTQAQSPTPPDPLCAQQDAVPGGAEAAGPDTDNVQLHCGDQGGSQAEGPDTAESGAPDPVSESATP